MADNGREELDNVPEKSAHTGGEPEMGSPAIGDRVLSQAFEIWFNAELERRSAAGELSEDFSLYAAQVLFPPDGEGEIEIRFNEQVTGSMVVVAQRQVEHGEQVFVSDLAEVQRYELDDADLDCGHITVIRRGQGWLVDFNALSGRAKAADLLRLAKQYHAAAVTCVEQELEGPAVDNLFSACELTAKAELILHRSHAVKGKSHDPIKSAINAWSKLGNIDPAFVETFNFLGNKRSDARYKGAEAAKGLMPSRSQLEIVQTVIERGEWRVSKTTDRKWDEMQQQDAAREEG